MMFETMVAGWVAFISVSHVPFHHFYIQSVASPLNLACALQPFFLLPCSDFHTGIGALQCMHALLRSFMSLRPRGTFFSLSFPITAPLHFHLISLVVLFVSSSLLYLLLVLHHLPPSRVMILLSSLHGGQSCYFHYLSHGH